MEQPWHQRIPLVGRMRTWLRGRVFRLVEQVLQTDDGRQMAAAALHGTVAGETAHLPLVNCNVGEIYPDLGTPVDEASAETAIAGRSDAVIITARFRSGSTLLWNIFRQMPGCTAYYEPLNERRWFDPSQRGEHTDATHRNVDNYWREYNGLELLSGIYRESWTRRQLYMDVGAWDPDLKRYIEILIDRAAARPVLQFNRIDFRLPWIRRNFPHAAIVHLYRHPRDQWCSTLVDPRACPRDVCVADFVPFDHYYLLNWARDLQYQFPFLNPLTVRHPYQLFYYLWKLSYLFGTTYGDYSLSLEQLVESPTSELQRLFDHLRIECDDVARLASLVERPHVGGWREYADDCWFAAHEAECEQVLSDFFQQPLAVPAH